MVLPHEFHYGGRGASRFEQGGAGFRMVKAAGDRPAPFEARRWPGEATGQSGAGREDEGDPVRPTLVALPDVVDQRGDDQVRFCVTMCEQVTGRVHGVEDVARMLTEEELEEIRREMRTREREVFFGRQA
jgi:hypothetical protein